jgi:hypothetical protein
MLDVHPAHHAASTWKEFFIHIATIVLGLIIAVGLEQLVEHIHHRIELADARKALAIERKIDIVRFSVENEEFHRFVPILQNNLAIFVYLRQHPGKPLPPSLGTLRWSMMTLTCWTVPGPPRSTAESSTTCRSPRHARTPSSMAASIRLTRRSAMRKPLSLSAYVSASSIPIRRTSRPSSSTMQIDLVSRALFAYRNIAFIMVNTREAIPDFTPSPSRSDLSAITHAETQSADDRRDTEATRRELKTARDYVRSLDQNEAPE